jgi:hypothetical protein
LRFGSDKPNPIGSMEEQITVAADNVNTKFGKLEGFSDAAMI